MAPKLKVYGITAFINAPLTPEMLGSAPHIRQAHAVVAAPSKKAAAEAFDVSMYELNRSGGETGNDEDIAVALSEPGTVFYRPMNGRGPSFRGDGTPAVTDTAPGIPESEVNAAARELLVITCNADFTTNHTANDQVRRQWDRGGFHADVVTGFKDRARAVLAAVQEVRP